MPSLQTWVLPPALCAVLSPVFPCTSGEVTQFTKYVTPAQLHLREIQMLSAAFSFIPKHRNCSLGQLKFWKYKGIWRNFCEQRKASSMEHWAQ